MGLGKFVFIVGVVVNFGGCTANVTVSHILHKLKCGYYNYSVEIYFEFCSDKRLRSYSSNKLKINNVSTELFKGTFSIDYHIYGTTCLINSGPLI